MILSQLESGMLSHLESGMLSHLQTAFETASGAVGGLCSGDLLDQLSCRPSGSRGSRDDVVEPLCGSEQAEAPQLMGRSSLVTGFLPGDVV